MINATNIELGFAWSYGDVVHGRIMARGTP